MKPLKKQVMDAIKALPDDATYEDIFEKIHFRMRIDAGLKEADEGKVISHEAVVQKSKKWLRK